MKLKNAQLFFDGKPVGQVMSLSFRETDGALTTEQISEAFIHAREVMWRGYRGFLVELQTEAERDGSVRVVKLEGSFVSPLTRQAVTVPIPPDEVRLAP